MSFICLFYKVWFQCWVHLLPESNMIESYVSIVFNCVIGFFTNSYCSHSLFMGWVMPYCPHSFWQLLLAGSQACIGGLSRLLVDRLVQVHAETVICSEILLSNMNNLSKQNCFCVSLYALMHVFSSGYISVCRRSFASIIEIKNSMLYASICKQFLLSHLQRCHVDEIINFWLLNCVVSLGSDQ